MSLGRSQHLSRCSSLLYQTVAVKLQVHLRRLPGHLLATDDTWLDPLMIILSRSLKHTFPVPTFNTLCSSSVQQPSKASAKAMGTTSEPGTFRQEGEK